MSLKFKFLVQLVSVFVVHYNKNFTAPKIPKSRCIQLVYAGGY